MCDRDHNVLRTAAGTAYAVRDLPQSQLRRLLQQPDALLWQNIDHPVKISHTTVMVTAELNLPGGRVRVAYKQYRPRNWWKALCGLFRGGRAWAGWRLGHALLARNIPTARPLALCQPRGRRPACRSYLATEWIEGAENLHLYGWRLACLPAEKRLRSAARCAQSLGQLVGRMHAVQVANRDLKAANLLVVDRQDRTTTYLTDVDGVRILRRLSPARRAADLARLAAGTEAHRWLTPSILLRFLRAYLSQLPGEPVAWKSLWREVAGRSRRLAERKRRRGEEVL